MKTKIITCLFAQDFIRPSDHTFDLWEIILILKIKKIEPAPVSTSKNKIQSFIRDLALKVEPVDPGTTINEKDFLEQGNSNQNRQA